MSCSYTEYDECYFTRTNYRDYFFGKYRFFHYVKFLWVGLLLKLLGVKRVFDFGCADGVSVAAFRLLGLEAWGCDVSAYAVSHCPDFVRDFVYVGDVFEKEWDDGYFDAVVSFDVLEHIQPDDLSDVLSELSRISRFGWLGIFVRDEFVAKLHRFAGIVHRDHVSEHVASWWGDLFRKRKWRYRKIPFSRKGSFFVSWS